VWGLAAGLPEQNRKNGSILSRQNLWHREPVQARVFFFCAPRGPGPSDRLYRNPRTGLPELDEVDRNRERGTLKAIQSAVVHVCGGRRSYQDPLRSKAGAWKNVSAYNRVWQWSEAANWGNSQKAPPCKLPVFQIPSPAQQEQGVVRAQAPNQTLRHNGGTNVRNFAAWRKHFWTE